VRKPVSIALIAILLFNTLGFYGLFMGVRMQSVQNLVQRLDQNSYADAETITLKIPMSLPYSYGNERYERVNGEIEFQGEFLRLVKQRISNDTLFIVCVKDVESKKITEALNDFVKTFSDDDGSTKNTGKVFQSIIKDYVPVSLTLETSNRWNNEQPVQAYAETLHGFLFTQKPVQPPDAKV